MSRKLLDGPDEAVRLWWSLAHREQSPNGVDPFLIKGNVAAVRCPLCGCTNHREVATGRAGAGWVDRCNHCGNPWPMRIEYVVRGTVQTSRNPHEFERRLVDLGDLEHAVDQLPEIESLLYGLYIATDRSYDYVAELATLMSLENPHLWIAPTGGFTPKRVRGAVKRARWLLSEALIARGLMARRVLVLMRCGAFEMVEALEPLPLEAVVPAWPSAWVGVLQDLEVSPEMRKLFPAARVTRLELTSMRGRGRVYRETALRRSTG